MLWGAKMVRTFSTTVPSMVEIVGRALAVDEKVWCFVVCFFTGSPVRSAAMPVLHLLSRPKMGFHPAITVKFGTRSRPQVRSSKLQVYRGRSVQPPKLLNFRLLTTNLPVRGDSFAQFLRNFQRLYASLG